MVCILPQPLAHRIRREEPLSSELSRRDVAARGGLPKRLWMDAELFGHLGKPIGAAHGIWSLTVAGQCSGPRKSQSL